MASDLTGKRVLIVEDEYFIAADLKRTLDDAGAEVVGPVGDLAAAIALAETRALDVAVLDVNLEGAFTFPLADRLSAAGVPHLFITGYDAWSLPPAYQATPRITKPFKPASIVEAVEGLCIEENPR